MDASACVVHDTAIPFENGLQLGAQLAIPAQTLGMVVFVHGSGSSRLSTRNQKVANFLNDAGFATLLFDLLSEHESLNRNNVFDINLLASRLIAATRWVTTQPQTRELPISYFGASTGAAAALVGSINAPVPISAIVSRGGRPDLADGALPSVSAPTLLIVGGADNQVLSWNQSAQRLLKCENRLMVVPGAGHLFEEPGAMEQVQDLALAWLLMHPPTKPPG